MGEKNIEEILADMSPASKKEVLDNLVIAILHDLDENEKKDLLRTVVTGQRESRHLMSMVEY